MWISGGAHDISEDIVHLVLAKVQDEAGALPGGTGGLSQFIVPAVLPDGRRNDVSVAGLNHLMGNRGTVNCLLNIGEGEGAVGWRIGRESEGLRLMFMMMNEARISVGLYAAAIAARGYYLSLEYARGRTQGAAFVRSCARSNRRACRRQGHVAGTEMQCRGLSSLVPLWCGRKVLRSGRGWEMLRERISASASRCVAHAELAELSAQLHAATASVGQAIEVLRAGDESEALANATSYLRALGHLVLGCIWLDLAATAAERIDQSGNESDHLA